MPVIGSRGMAVLGLATRAGRPLGPRQEEVPPAQRTAPDLRGGAGVRAEPPRGCYRARRWCNDQPVQADGLVSGRLHRG